MSEQLPAFPESGVPVPARPEPRDMAAGGLLSESESEVGEGGRQRYLDAIRRRKWLILGVVVLGTAAGVVASRFVHPIYEARSTLWVSTDDSKSADQGPIRSDELLQSTAWVELLRSFVILDEVVQSQQLYLEVAPEHRATFADFTLKPRFRPGDYVLKIDASGRQYTVQTDDGAQIEQGTLGDSIGAAIGFNWKPSAAKLTAGESIPFSVQNPRDVAVALSKKLSSPMEKGSNFLRLSLQGTDPAQTSSTVNAVAEQFVNVAAELKRSKLEELTMVLDEQLRFAEQNLSDAELALENFRVHTITLPSENATPVAPGLQQTQSPVLSRFFDMKVDREQLRIDREAVERWLADPSVDSISLGALSVIPSVQTSPALKQALDEDIQKRADLRALRQRYTDEYRPVSQLIAQVTELEQVTIPRLAAQLRDQLAARENELGARIDSSSTELQSIPPRALEEARLERQQSIAENLHKTLKQRYEEAKLAAASTIPDIRILDRAVIPTRPVSDPRKMVIFLGFAGALALAVGGVIAADRFDPRVRYPEQITAGLGLPILGVVPNVENKSSKRDHDSRHHAAEAFRELRLNLLHAAGAAGPPILTVTSPESGDGKSFVSSNLATAFGDQGIQTLLIDGDTRRGVLHHIFHTTRSPGLTDYLAGKATLQEIIQKTSAPSVFLIGSGTRMHNGPELLSGAGFAKMLVSLKPHFGTILVDSPPLGAGVDAYAIATATRDMILVVRTGNTNRAFAGAKLSLVDRLPVRLLGAVLNGTPASRVYQYYSYLPGYDATEEVAPAENEDIAAMQIAQPEGVG